MRVNGLWLLALAWLAGCQAAPPVAPNAVSNIEQPAGSRPLVQASHVDPQGPKYVPPPGTSILNLDEEEEHSFWQSAAQRLSPKNALARFKNSMGLGPNEPLAQQMYEEGDALFRQANYQQAARRFKKAGKRWPDSVLEEDALFMLGESYFFSDRYPKASNTYANLLKKYENSRHLDKVTSRHFAIARYWEEMGQQTWKLVPNLTDKTRPLFDTTGNAIGAYQSIRLNDPTGPLADDATMATANLYFLKGHWEDAAYHYDLVRKEFPRSEHQPQAHVLGLRSQLLAYQGPQYDTGPLLAAEELVDQALIQFPDQLQGERERLLQTRQAIRYEKAQRDWQAAEYYYNSQWYRAARYYYVALEQQYPDTPFAGMARERMQETENLPPEPPNRFWWLTNLFPESKKL